jgi:hypothetical protein
MQKNTLNRSKNTVSAPYLPYTAYKAFVEGATALNAQIERDAKGATKATFNSVDDAKKFVTNWTANYNANRKVEVAPTPKSTPTQKSTTSKPTATKGKTTSSTKKPTAPRKAKGEAFDFGKIKGNTKSEKNRALHAMLVGMGHADSRTPEYQAVWNARPWAK